MSRRDNVLATLKHEESVRIPSQTWFFDINALKKFVPIFSPDWQENTLRTLEFLNNYFVEVGSSKVHESQWLRETSELERGTFFRCVGGVVYTKVIEETGQDLVFEFETGARWRIHKSPFWREYIRYPIQQPGDLNTMKVLDPHDPRRYKGVRENVKYFKQKGYFTYAEIHGFFSGVWYRYYNLEDFMVDMTADKELARNIVNMVGEFNLETAKGFLERGVDCIVFPDDLGSNAGMLISPQLYTKFFYPWHKRLAELCHQYGGYLNMHSHGNINEIVPLLVDAGIDILNPVGPSDNMDLRELKAKYGNRITFMGGVSKFIGEMDKDELEAHLKEIIETGAPGAGFIVMPEGGIPCDMNKENFQHYLSLIKKFCYKEQ